MTYFGEFGGLFVPETLVSPLQAISEAYENAKKDPAFQSEFQRLLREYAGRPSMLYFAKNLSVKYGCRIYLKREDLLHTGSHKINNALGQALLAKSMGKTRVIAETGAGQHGVACATVCALMGLKCVVYMGSEDVIRQNLNVQRMRLLGATVVPVESGTKTLKDAINEALRDFVANPDSYYLIGSAVGPTPYPEMVRDFQRAIGDETKAQILKAEGRLPDAVVACVGGGSNAIGMFYSFKDDQSVKKIGVEAYGAASLGYGQTGVLHGAKTKILQDSDGQISGTHSISAGLDYSAVGPEHAFFQSAGIAKYVSANDEDALFGFKELSLQEGIIPALESAHAVAHGLKVAKTMTKDQILVINLSGRGDKDAHALEALGKEKEPSAWGKNEITKINAKTTEANNQ
ncbi:tryptophan synthase subunit beta [Candidatus Micrarchaeota archaeon]|nr:tryptophan synthase subunit beta [Candidatus Micrarchaeota archaeon]